MDIGRYTVRVERHELPQLIDRLRAIPPREGHRLHHSSTQLHHTPQAEPNPHPNPQPSTLNLHHHAHPHPHPRPRPRQVQRMQAELRTVWERYTYSGLFKREYRLQLAASQLTPKAKRRRLTARLGAPSLQDKHSFAPLEPWLSGVDAVDSLIALLRRRLRHPGVPAADQLVPHGPIAAPLPLIPGYRLPDTAGVQ